MIHKFEKLKLKAKLSFPYGTIVTLIAYQISFLIVERKKSGKTTLKCYTVTHDACAFLRYWMFADISLDFMSTLGFKYETDLGELRLILMTDYSTMLK